MFSVLCSWKSVPRGLARQTRLYLTTPRGRTMKENFVELTFYWVFLLDCVNFFVCFGDTVLFGIICIFGGAVLFY
jgi:hypothetical protein